jgi:uncharacterized membrane protein YhaH (DUF805 family)
MDTRSSQERTRNPLKLLRMALYPKGRFDRTQYFIVIVSSLLIMTIVSGVFEFK